jgi:hypothetical protein
MDVGELMKAARLADELSRARFKRIRLVLTTTGVLVDGELYRADGVLMQHYRAEHDWAQIQSGSEVLERSLRSVESRLVADWRNEPPAEEP